MPSQLEKANLAFRAGRYSEALQYYLSIRTNSAEFKKMIQFNMALIEQKLGNADFSDLVGKQGVDVVIFWKQNDTGLYGRRVDMVVSYLASREDVRKVIVFDAPILASALADMQVHEALTHNHHIYSKAQDKLAGLLDTVKVAYKVFVYEAVHQLDFDEYAAFIANVFEREAVDASQSCFWFYPQINDANSIIDYFNPKKVVVDIVDDHRAWPNVTDEKKQALTEQYQRILGKADIAFANCQPVVDAMKVFKSDIQLIPNGCETNPEIVEPENHHFYDELKSFNGTVIGFIGNLESKIDIPLIEKIAQTFSEALVVLIGSTHANPKARVLQKFSNVRMFGVVDYQNIHAVVRLFDVGILPHLKMDLTKHMNPLKAYVYLANKVPVVATDIENVADSQLIYRAVNHDDFIDGLKKTLMNRSNVNPLAFDHFVVENAWSKRFEGLSFD